MKRSQIFAIGLALIVAAGSTVASTGSATATTRLATVATPAFMSDLPVGWSATWYPRLRSVLATPATENPGAPSLLVGLAGDVDRVDPDALARRLEQLIADGGRFTAIVDQESPNGHLVVFDNERGDIRAAIWLEVFDDRRRSATALLAAPKRAFDDIDALSLVRRVAASVRPVEEPAQPSSDLAATTPKPADAATPAAEQVAAAATTRSGSQQDWTSQPTFEAPPSAPQGTLATPSEPRQEEASQEEARQPDLGQGAGGGGSSQGGGGQAPEPQPLASSDAAPGAPAQTAATPTPTAARAMLDRLIDQTLAATDAPGAGGDGGVAADMLLVLRGGGVAERRRMTSGGGQRSVGTWTYLDGIVSIAWNEAAGAASLAESAPIGLWRLNVSEEGLRTPSVVLRPVVEATPQDLFGRLILRGNRALRMEPQPGGAVLDVSRLDFSPDGRFSAGGAARSSGGVYVAQGRNLLLRFYSGGEARVIMHALQGDGAIGAARRALVLDGRVFDRAALD